MRFGFFILQKTYCTYIKYCSIQWDRKNIQMDSLNCESVRKLSQIVWPVPQTEWEWEMGTTDITGDLKIV